MCPDGEVVKSLCARLHVHMAATGLLPNDWRHLPQTWSRQAASQLPLPPPLPDALVCGATFAADTPALGWPRPLGLPPVRTVVAGSMDGRRHEGSTSNSIDCSAGLMPSCCAAVPPLLPGFSGSGVSTHLAGGHGRGFDSAAVLQQGGTVHEVTALLLLTVFAGTTPCALGA